MERKKTTNLCPVCGKLELKYMEIRPVCDWQNDLVQLAHPDWEGCANRMSLNQAKQAWAEGRKIL